MLRIDICFVRLPLIHAAWRRRCRCSLRWDWLVPRLSYPCPDLVHSRQVWVQKHHIGLSVCIIHELPLLSGQLFSIRIPDEVQSRLHSPPWLLAIDHKRGTQVLNKHRGFMSKPPHWSREHQSPLNWKLTNVCPLELSGGAEGRCMDGTY